jgi:DNA replication protein DnaC
MINTDKKRTFESFEVSEGNKLAFEKAKVFEKSERGLYIFGNAGIGKTHLAIASCSEITSTKRFISVPELLLQIRSSFNKYSIETENDIIDELTGFERFWVGGIEIEKANAEYLYLDDFGAEKITDFSLETMYLILDRRIRRDQLKVFITSNFSISQIAEIMSDRIASRLIELCKVCKIEGEDWRLKNEHRK